MDIGQISHCQAQPVGLKQGASDGWHHWATPTFAGGQAEGSCQVWMELIKSFCHMSDGIVMRYAHTSQWAGYSPLKLPLPRGMQIRSPSSTIWQWIGQGQPPCIAKRHLDPVQLFKHSSRVW